MSEDRSRIEAEKEARAHQIPPPPVHRDRTHRFDNSNANRRRYGRGRFRSISRSRSRSWSHSPSRSHSPHSRRRFGNPNGNAAPPMNQGYPGMSMPMAMNAGSAPMMDAPRRPHPMDPSAPGMAVPMHPHFPPTHGSMMPGNKMISPAGMMSGRMAVDSMMTGSEKVPLNFKEFVERRSKDDISAEEAERIYKEYLNTFGQSEEEKFFNAHINEEWFQERYDPVCVEGLQRQRAKDAQHRAAHFWSQLLKGQFEEAMFNLKEEEKEAFMDDCLPRLKDHIGFTDEEEKEKETEDETMEKEDDKKEKKDEMDESKPSEDEETMAVSTSVLAEVDEPGEMPDNEKHDDKDVGMHDEDGSEGLFHDNSVFLNGIPLTLKRITLQKVFEDFLSKNGGELKSVTFSDPIRNRQKVRYCWIELDSQQTCRKVSLPYDQGGLDNARITETFFLQVLPKQRSNRRPRVCPTESMKPARIAKDIERCTTLIHMLDKFSRITAVINPMFKPINVDNRNDSNDNENNNNAMNVDGDESNTNKKEANDTDNINNNSNNDDSNKPSKKKSESILSLFVSDIQRLNILQLYLRKVHLVCYYCGSEYLSFEHLLGRCSKCHSRKERDWISEDGGTYDFKESPWEVNLDRKIDALLSEIENRTDLLSEENEIANNGAIPSAKGMIDTSHSDSAMNSDSVWMRVSRESVMMKMCKKISDGKHRCRLCKKCFKGQEFVMKHLKNRHSEDIQEELEKTRRKVTLKSYVKDADRVDAQTFERDDEMDYSNSIRSRYHRRHGGWNGRRRSDSPGYGRFRGGRRGRYRGRSHRGRGFFAGAMRGGRRDGQTSRRVRNYSDVDVPTDDSIDYGFGDATSNTTFGL